MIDDRGVHRGHGGEDRGTMLGDRVHHCGHVARIRDQRDRSRDPHREIHADRHAEAVEDRQGGQHYFLAGLEAREPRPHLLHVAGEVAVRQQRALGGAGRSAGVLQGRDVVEPDRDPRRARRVLLDQLPEEMHAGSPRHVGDRRRLRPLELEAGQQVQGKPEILGDRCDDVVLDREPLADAADLRLEDEVRHHRHPAVRILPLVLDLPRDVERVREYGVGAELQRRVVGDHRLRDVRELDRDAGARPHAKRPQGVGQTIHRVFELAVRNAAVVEQQGGGVAVPRRRPLEELRQRQRLVRQRRRHAAIVAPVPNAGLHDS